MKTTLQLILVLILFFLPSYTHAQNADGLYKDGMALISAAKKKTSKAEVSNLCEQAKKKFSASKFVDKSNENKKRCDRAIAEANNVKRNYPRTVPKKGVIINIEPSELNFEAESNGTKEAIIEIKGDHEEWTVEVEDKEQIWCKAEKGNDNEKLIVSCQENKQTIGRQTAITVRAGNSRKAIKVYQEPSPVVIGSDKTFLKVSKKAKKPETIVVNCNSSVFDNDGFNIKTIKKPDWCDVTYMPLQPKETQEQIRSWQLTIQVHSLGKSNPSYKAGRSGDLILGSQGTEYIIRIDQK